MTRTSKEQWLPIAYNKQNNIYTLWSCSLIQPNGNQCRYFVSQQTELIESRTPPTSVIVLICHTTKIMNIYERTKTVVADLGEDPGCQFFFLRPHWGSKGQEESFYRPSHPLSYLKVWIHHCAVSIKLNVDHFSLHKTRAHVSHPTNFVFPITFSKGIHRANSRALNKKS